MNYRQTISLAKRAMLLTLVGFLLISTGCKDNGGAPTDPTVITGTITFTYKGAAFDPAKWPNSSDSSLAFPSGYVRIAVNPSNEAGAAIAAPAKIFGGNSTGIQISELSNGVYTYRLETPDILENSYYLILPTYVNPAGTRGGPGGDIQVALGYNGAQTINGLGTPVKAVPGITVANLTVDLAMGEYAYNASKAKSQMTILGTVKVDQLEKWPTGGKYLAVVGYKSGVTPGPGIQPDLFVKITKPVASTVAPFSKNSGFNGLGFVPYQFGTYDNISVGIYNSDNTLSSTLSSMTTASGATSVTTNAQNYMMIWHPQITLPAVQ
ncbi:MAG: hypothetical protein SFU91_13045 [Chloroherpetonaceae bacterium]|nr:hypothetical protein [Chloroherpetonaceae bacterium]